MFSSWSARRQSTWSQAFALSSHPCRERSAPSVQIVAVAVVMMAAQTPSQVPATTCPTVYASVFSLTLFSGIHYIFFVSRLLNEEPPLNSPRRSRAIQTRRSG